MTNFSQSELPQTHRSVNRIVSNLCMTRRSISQHVSDSIAELNELCGEIEPLFIARAVRREQEFIQFLDEIVATAYLQLLKMIDGDVAFFPKFVIETSKGGVLPSLAEVFECNSVTQLHHDSTFKDVRDAYGVMHTETSDYESFVAEGRDVDVLYREYIFSMIAKCTYRVAVDLVYGIEDRLFTEIVINTREQQFGNLLYFILEQPVKALFAQIDKGLRKNQLRLLIGGKTISPSDSRVHLLLDMARAFDENFHSMFVEQLTEIIRMKAFFFEEEYSV